MSSNTDIHTNIRKQCQRQKINIRNIQNLYSMFMLSEGSNLGNGSITSINKAYNEVLLPWNKNICISNIRANPISIHYNIRPIWCHFFLRICGGVCILLIVCGYDQIQTQLVTKLFFFKVMRDVLISTCVPHLFHFLLIILCIYCLSPH